MREIARSLLAWHTAGRRYALASVVAVRGSAPRLPGAALAVDEAGEAVGSVSGGCVEAAVYELCREALRTGEPAFETFGYSAEDAFAIGLTCGGELDVFVQPMTPGSGADPLATALRAMVNDAPAGLARIIDGPDELRGRTIAIHAMHTVGSLGGGENLDRTVAAHAGALLDLGRTGTFTVGADGGVCGAPLTVFAESHGSAPRLIVFGAIDFAAALVTAGKFLGFHVTVCDARPVFATRARFPDADEIAVDWPHRYLAEQAPHLDSRTAVCVLTHDAKFDIPVLSAALRMPLGYVGAMGSRRTCAQRLDSLRREGLDDRQLTRLHAPIGLDLGGRTAQETAIAIVAEIVAARHGGSASGLSATSTPIHASSEAKEPVCP